MFLAKEAEKGCLWHKHKEFADSVVKVGCIVLTLKLAKMAVDMLQL